MSTTYKWNPDGHFDREFELWYWYGPDLVDGEYDSAIKNDEFELSDAIDNLDFEKVRKLMNTVRSKFFRKIDIYDILNNSYEMAHLISKKMPEFAFIHTETFINEMNNDYVYVFDKYISNGFNNMMVDFLLDRKNDLFELAINNCNNARNITNIMEILVDKCRFDLLRMIIDKYHPEKIYINRALERIDYVQYIEHCSSIIKYGFDCIQNRSAGNVCHYHENDCIHNRLLMDARYDNNVDAIRWFTALCEKRSHKNKN